MRNFIYDSSLSLAHKVQIVKYWARQDQCGDQLTSGLTKGWDWKGGNF